MQQNQVSDAHKKQTYRAPLLNTLFGFRLIHLSLDIEKVKPSHLLDATVSTLSNSEMYKSYCWTSMGWLSVCAFHALRYRHTVSLNQVIAINSDFFTPLLLPSARIPFSVFPPNQSIKIAAKRSRGDKRPPTLGNNSLTDG